MKYLIVAIALVWAWAVPAVANGCPYQVKHLAMVNKTVPDDATMKKVLALIALAKTEHTNGNLAASLAHDKEVDRLLGM